MKGNAALIEAMNNLISDELAAISQYIVQSETADNWGYEKLHAALFGLARSEMGHVEKLVARIVFLDGAPDLKHLGKIKVGSTVPEMLASDLESEMRADEAYNEAVKKAVYLLDTVTRELLESIAAEEEAHIDWIEAQRTQIEQMGIGNYLAGLR